MDMNREEYAKYTKRHMPRSRAGRNMLRAFVTGGLICALGQGLLALYLRLGLTEESAGAAVSVTLIFLGALLTGLGVYDKLAKFGGAFEPFTGRRVILIDGKALVVEPPREIHGLGAVGLCCGQNIAFQRVLFILTHCSPVTAFKARFKGFWHIYSPIILIRACLSRLPSNSK